jgi:hypothetical protein
MHTQLWSEKLKGRPRRKWKDNARMCLRKVRWEVLAQDGNGGR